MNETTGYHWETSDSFWEKMMNLENGVREEADIPVSRMPLSQKPFEEATLLFKSLKNALLFRREHFLKNKSFCFRKH